MAILRVENEINKKVDLENIDEFDSVKAKKAKL